jgi:Ca2+-binding RTX toxin-like protein
LAVYLTTAGDVVVEFLNQGIDEVRTTSAAFALGLNIENLTATNAISHTLTGNTLNNAITGNTAADTLNGGAGNDTLDGGAGIDRLIGSLGDDIFIVTAGDVVVEGVNAGTDTVRVTTGTGFTLGLNLEVLVLAGATLVTGVGNTLDNILTGNANNNVLYGLAGADALMGEGGADILIGGAGQDTLTGRSGNDQFRINAIFESTVAAPDLILDFSFAPATGIDRVDLRAIDANTGLAGDQAFIYRGAAFTGAAGDLRVQALGGGICVAAGDVDGDAVADFAVTIQSTTGPSAGWFLL